MKKVKDKIFSEKLQSVKDFEFNQQVANVFDDMIGRSVPLYQQVQIASCKLALEHYIPDSYIYDLGCASGTTLELIIKSSRDTNLKLIGIDNSDSMLLVCKEKLRQYSNYNIELINADLENFNPNNASVVIMNYTLQFIDPEKRKGILSRIYKNLLPQGVLILSEKVIHHGPCLEKVIYALHHQYKESQGYSKLEISQKRNALENVLKPMTLEDNISLLKEVGFSEVELLSKLYNFASLVAIKY